jgi:opacity protein-like surface antigen
MWRDVSFKVDSPFGGMAIGLSNAWAVGARAGYVLPSGVMPYALIGYTKSDLNLPAGTPISSDLKGWMMGGGIEVPLAKNLSFAGEARWTRFDKIDLTPVGLPADLKTDAMSVIGRINFTLQ